MKNPAFLFLNLLVTCLIQIPVFSQDNNRTEIQIPNVPGFYTLKCDFHMHTVFSDGSVWPTLRVREAWTEGLDAIAITDHIEYRPHKEDIISDHNRSYEIAKPYALELGIILIKASEITRSMPPGHFNALFITDSKSLDTENWMDALKAAAAQGAFIFWNHPGWKAQQPDTTKWFEEHSRLLSEGILKGIEVVNYQEWYPGALHWAIDKNLTILCNSDAHDPVSFDFNTISRPLTLVFAKERSEEAIREALFAKRSVALYNDTLLGRQELLAPLFAASVEITSRSYKILGNHAYVQIRNNSSIPYHIKVISAPEGITPASSLFIPGMKTVIWPVSVKDRKELKIEVPVKVKITNLLIDQDIALETELDFSLER
jgi:predicted metal-dependent phosphoesterase TrpH